ncbi:MAG: hypothetical protein LBG88_03985 [Christensenellaceae bacterium]|nr:hypothetical protein [Christensenellaceae bacterium]
MKEKKASSGVRKHYKWFIFIIIFSFAIAFAFGIAAEAVSTNSIIICVSIITVLLVIAFVGDVFAVAVAYADLADFNAMASRRLKGAKMAIRLIKHSDKVSSILSDVLGDVCGIVSGAMGVALSLAIVNGGNFTVLQQGLIIAAVNATIAALAISVKSLAKKIAIHNSTKIVLVFGKILAKVWFR